MVTRLIILCHSPLSSAPDAEDMKEAVTVGYVLLGATPICIFALSDTCRTGAKDGIKELKSLGIKTAMLTGDSTTAAMHAQKQVFKALRKHMILVIIIMPSLVSNYTKQGKPR